MTLYRITYIREAKPRGITFAAASDAAASRFAEKWVAGFGGRLLTVNFAKPQQMRLV